CARRGAFFYSW
nr:immunoglobulin heavy chain junction region [Macaca mulatta]